MYGNIIEVKNNRRCHYTSNVDDKRIVLDRFKWKLNSIFVSQNYKIHQNQNDILYKNRFLLGGILWENIRW